MLCTSYDEGDIAQLNAEDGRDLKWNKVVKCLARLHEIDSQTNRMQTNFMSEDWVAAVGDLLNAYDDWLD